MKLNSWALGFGLWALGFGLWALGFGLWALGFGLWASASELATTHETNYSNVIVGSLRYLNSGRNF